MIRRLLLSVSFEEVEGALETARREGLGIEVTLYDTHWLMSEGAVEDARAMGERLAREGIPVTAHGPLYDLNPGSLDPTIRSYTRECMLRGVEVTGALGGGKVVYHTFYNPLLPGGVLPGWKELARPVWGEAVSAAKEAGISLCMENSYEPTAEFFQGLLEDLAEGADVCFDPAHVHLYSRDGQSAWVVTLGHRVNHVHLNDNAGSSDDHLALGRGDIPYGSFLEDMCRACGRESTVVLEMTLPRALESLGFLRAMDLWDGGGERP
ncbi:MAG: sugar phosphate isomerase/epimerase family protein [bacterium]